METREVSMGMGADELEIFCFVVRGGGGGQKGQYLI